MYSVIASIRRGVREWRHIYYLGILLSLVFSTLASAAYLSHQLFLRQQFQAQQKNDLKEASVLIAQRLKVFDLYSIEEIANTLMQRVFVLGIKVSNTAEQVVFEKYKTDKAEGAYERLYYLVNSDLEENSALRIIGDMRVTLVGLGYREVILDSLVVLVWLFSFSLLCSLSFVIVYLRIFVVLPIRQFSNAISRSTFDGRPVKTHFESEGHLGMLAKKFNNMQDRLAEIQSSLINSLEELAHRSRITIEQAEVLEQILVSGKQGVRYFDAYGQMHSYNNSRQGAALFEQVPEFPVRDEHKLRELILAADPTIKRVQIIHREAYDDSIETRKLFELEITDLKGSLRSLVGVQMRKGNLALLATDITVMRAMEAATQQAHKMEALGSLTGGVAHDINNYLAIMSGKLQLIQLINDDKSATFEHAETALQAANRGASVVRSLLMFSRQEPIQSSRECIADLVFSMLPMLDMSVGSGIDIKLDLDYRGQAIIDRHGLESVLLNLVVNAKHAMSGSGRVLISVKRATKRMVEMAALQSRRHYLSLQVKDTGTGISDEIFSKIADPFFTTKESGEGTGMGLAMAHAYVGRFNGRLVYWNNVDVGSTFALIFPDVLGNVSPLFDARDPHYHVNRLRGQALFVDDEREICQVFSECMKNLGLKVSVAYSVAEARSLIESSFEFQLIITDLNLPDGTGHDIHDFARQEGVTTPILLMSAHLDFAGEKARRERGYARELVKPVTLAEFRTVVRQSLDNGLRASGSSQVVH